MDSEFFQILGLLVVSMGVLLVAADRFVVGTEDIGNVLGVSPFIMGITVLAVGTSFPELITALYAVEEGKSEIVIGTVLGSNIANILLILGVTAILAKSFTITWDLLHGDLPILFGSLLLMGFVIYPVSIEDQKLFQGLATQISQTGSGDAGGRAFITFGESIILLAGYVLYLYYYTLRHQEEVAKGKAGDPQERPKFKYMSLVWVLVGLAGVLVGAKFTVDFAVDLAGKLNLGNEVVAASMIAFGTSMPELVVSISASRRGNFEMVLGNVTGSNIFNTFVVIGIPGLVAPFMGDGVSLKVGEDSILLLQFPFYAATLALFLVVVLDKTLTRTEGWIIFMAYVLFISKLFSFI
ncbi:MAG: calcium/sodium antiporter [SAR324 cluster bacterium]|nr:calcium/sodium antiporter [SAR324 cluster bacterium]